MLHRRYAPILCAVLAACSPRAGGNNPSVDAAPADDVGSVDAPPEDAAVAVDATDAPSADETAADVGEVDASLDAGPSADAPAGDVPGPDASAVDVSAADAPTSDVPAAVDARADVPGAVDVPRGADGAVACRSSLECRALDFVCDTTRMICVECVGDNDCPTTEVCTVDSVCEPPRCPVVPPTCTSDGRLRICDPRRGIVEAPCPTGSVCSGGQCVARVCTPGAVACGAGAERRVCSSDGRTWMSSLCPGAAHAAGACSAGACVLACEAGYANCDAASGNGCEVDTRTSPAHCGACGRPCPSGSTCVAGACSSGGCTGGMTLCGGRCVDTRSDPAHCGGCGLACATTGVPNGRVGCVSGACTMICAGSYYDVNGMTQDGCETPDDTLAGYSQSTATPRGSQGCSDTTRGTISGGRIVSDGRVHMPEPPGYVATTHAVPDWYSVRAIGGSLCANNYGITVTTSGGTSPGQCYQVTFLTDRVSPSMTVSGNGSNTMSSGALGLYTENSTVYFRVERICSLATGENVSYSLTFNL